MTDTAKKKYAPKGPSVAKECLGCHKPFLCVASRVSGENVRKFCDRRCQRLWREQQGPVLFWSKVEKREGNSCWGWKGHSRWDGYGRFRHLRKAIFAHRYSYEMHYGPIPAGMSVMHSCDNPICTNPKHLRVGTHLENMKDMRAKGRGPDQRRSA